MITGAIWGEARLRSPTLRRGVSSKTMFSMLVIALHTACLVASSSALAWRGQLLLALAAFATYVVNATQLSSSCARRQLGERVGVGTLEVAP